MKQKHIDFSFSRSGGKGGQHVNKTETKVVGRLKIVAGELFTEEESSRLLKRLQNKINQEGELVLTDESGGSQHQNRSNLLAKFQETISQALKKKKRRKPTKPTKAAIRKRLKQKKQQAEKKQRRNLDFNQE